MSPRRMIQWLALALTAGLLMFLKWLHIGVTTYNIFLIILLGWSMVLIVSFRTLTHMGPPESED